jgi:hypothetical protein
MNSKPSVPIGLSQGVNFIACSGRKESGRVSTSARDRRLRIRVTNLAVEP